jgi:hypothetical protein
MGVNGWLTTPATLIVCNACKRRPCYPNLRRRWQQVKAEGPRRGFPDPQSFKPAQCRPIEPARVPERGPFSLMMWFKDFWRE